MSHGNATRNHLLKRDVHRVRVREAGARGAGRYWLFTFSEAWGPLLTDEWGDPIDNTPLADEAHPFWDAFEAWQALHFPRGASPAHASDEVPRSPHEPDLNRMGEEPANSGEAR